MKIYKANENLDAKKSPAREKPANFADDFRAKKNEKSQKFARKNDENFRENAAEKFVSYEDFYEKNGRDSPFGGMKNRAKKAQISPHEYYEKQKNRREKIAKKISAERDLRERLADGSLENREFVITKIAPAAQTPGRYNVFVDGDFSFSLDEIQLVGERIKKGEKLDSSRFLALKQASDFGKNYVRALDLLSRRMRSEKEIRDYGFRKKWNKIATEKVVERLRERGYLDDEKFAKNFVAARVKLQNFSRRKMEIELMKRGISAEIREKALRENEEFDEQKSLQKLVAKKFDRYDDERKLVAFLARRGFNYGDIKVAIAEFRAEK